MNVRIREMKRPADNAAAVAILNTFDSEPITTAQFQEDKIPPGELQWNENGELTGWDRPKWVAEDENGRVIGYAVFRAEHGLCKMVRNLRNGMQTE